MGFECTIRALVLGRKVRLPQWPKDSYLYIVDNVIKLHKEYYSDPIDNSIPKEYIDVDTTLNSEELLRRDWEIYV